jgi:hypothetical protein
MASLAFLERPAMNERDKEIVRLSGISPSAITYVYKLHNSGSVYRRMTTDFGQEFVYRTSISKGHDQKSGREALSRIMRADRMRLPGESDKPPGQYEPATIETWAAGISEYEAKSFVTFLVRERPELTREIRRQWIASGGKDWDKS